MPTLVLSLVVTAVLHSPPPVGADSCVLFTGGRIFASEFGTHGFRMKVGQATSVGELFTFDRSGRERQVWKARLVATPARVLLDPSGRRVVTLDMTCRSGYEHSLVVYGDGGRVIADYSLDDLLSAEERQSHVTGSISSRFWAKDAVFTFDAQRERLVIRFAWGREGAVDLVTGQILDADAPSPFLQPLDDTDREIVRLVVESMKPEASAVMLDSTLPYCKEPGRIYFCLPDATSARIDTGSADDDSRIRSAFVARNQRSWPLGELHLPVRPADGTKVRSLFREGRGWPGVHQLIPNVRDLIQVSAPGYSADRRRAVVFAERRCDGRCGGGGLFLVEREGGRWKIVRSLWGWEG